MTTNADLMHFEIGVVFPQTEKQPYARNVMLDVVAYSLRSALGLVERYHPGVKIVSINGRGKLDLIEGRDP